jgi:hypothetical protein
LGRGVATMELNKAVVEVRLTCWFRNNHVLTFPYRPSSVSTFSPAVWPSLSTRK